MTDVTPTSSPLPGSHGPSARARVWIRLLVSPLLLGAVLGVLLLHDGTGSPLPTDVFLFVVGALGALELARLLASSGRPILVWVATLGSGLVAGVGLFAAWDAPARMELRALWIGATLLFLLFVHLRDTRPQAIERIALTLLPVLYVGFLLSWIREVGIGPLQARYLVWIVVTAKASDMAGWLIGKPFGRHKLIPSVSPGKSWEGLLAGLAGSVLVAILLPGLLDIPSQAWSPVRRGLFGLALGGASVLAGITLSAWKRRVGTKDSAALIPEIGGILDMIDSLLLAAPVAWIWFRLGL